ncbi:MAG: polymerase, sigma-24 subunit, subfamily [Myxococcaceae bacterium]|nr:polymerase, sigma-24 subunit, subfamily [Myxococcaceae bacterium]
MPAQPPAPRPPSAGLDDAELLAALRKGDRTAATALYIRTRPQADRTIARLVGRSDSSYEDLVQLAMIELVRSIDQFRGECSLDTWTARIAARTVFKELRRRRSETALFSAISGQDHEPTGDAQRDLLLRSTLARVREHLDAIDPVKAWTVMLHDVCGYDLQEIASITDVSVAAAQSRLVRGRGELNARIEADAELTELLSSKGES